MLMSMPNSRRLISVLAEKPARWPPNGSAVKPLSASYSGTDLVTPCRDSSPSSVQLPSLLGTSDVER
jgi:hypothetical protein